jgi:8-oxo-dGTP diphosphatase
LHEHEDLKETAMKQEVVAALIVESQMILLGKRAPTRTSYPNVWDVFGGHIEAGEQPHQTLVRELQEELDITPTKWTFLETIVASIPEQSGVQPYPLYLHLYLVTAWVGTPINQQLHEHASIEWFSLEQAMQLDLAHPAYPQIFVKYLTPSLGFV